jgi:hypothetical protein
MYHATTLLLPDARVLVTGQDDGPGRLTGEIYRPPYLFRGARPEIVSAPARLAYDRWFSVEADDAADIGSVVLVKLSAVTHSVNFEQRLLDLAFHDTGDGATLRARAPLDGFHAPPGHYMLFVVDADGVPSVAEIVHLLPGLPGDVDGDQAVDFNDLLRVLGAWGDCESEDCPEDLDGDGDVDLDDVLRVLANWTG